MNELEHATRPKDFWAADQNDLETMVRFYDLPIELHRLAADASRLLSLRPYFTRLWVC